MKGDKTQLRTPQIRPYPLQEKFKILFLGGYVYDVTNSMQLHYLLSVPTLKKTYPVHDFLTKVDLCAFSQ